MIVEIDYTNWQGKRSVRQIIPKNTYFGSNEWHPEEQWLLDATDVEKKAPRTFAHKDIHEWRPFEPFKKGWRSLADVALCFAPTPNWLAEKVIEEAQIEPGMSVLEPSAGNGVLAKHCPEPGKVVCFELDANRASMLTQMGFVTTCCDFLEQEPGASFDRIVMSPPFRDSGDLKHVRHAMGYLKPGGKLVSLMRAGLMSRVDKFAQEFQQLLVENDGDLKKVREDAFPDVEAIMVSMVKA